MFSKNLSAGKKVAIFGKIFTSNVQEKWAEAVIYENDTIAYVGTRAEAEKLLDGSTQRVEIGQESIILPGFVDSHLHYILGGLQLMGHSIETCCSLNELKVQVQNYLSIHPDAEWVFANGYNDMLFPDAKPHRKYLDEMCPDKPMALMRFDWHTYLVNTKALEVSHITKDTVDPLYGVIEKDENGELTGLIHEKAMDLIKANFPERNPDDYKQALYISAEIFIKEGITSCMDAMVKAPRCKAFHDIYQENTKSLPRASICVLWDKKLERYIDSKEDGKINLYEYTGIPEQDKLKINTVKFFVDGVVESQTALLEEPYICDKKDYCGIQLFEDEVLLKYVSKLHQSGVQAHFHALGDGAVRLALDAIEYAKIQDGGKSKDPRHYLAHLQLIKEKDYKRFKELGAGTTFSPAWFCSIPETRIADEFLGPERAKLQYPVKDLLNAGALVSFGSDWPVTTPRPLDGIETAVIRKIVGAKKEQESFCKEQCFTVEEAILAYTINSAYAINQDTITGSLEAGKKADIVVVNKNIFECDPTTIHEAQISLTIIDGEILYSSIDGVQAQNLPYVK